VDPSAVATLAVLVAEVMLVPGLLRLGFVMSLVSTAVMTGFSAEISLQPPLGVGAQGRNGSSQSANTVGKLVNSVVHITRWDVTTMRIAIGIVLAWPLIRPVHGLVSLAILIALVVVTAVDDRAPDVELVSDVVAIPRSLPSLW